MLTLLTGKPGACKTQYAIKRWIFETRQDKDEATKGRPIYTNITGLRADLIQQRAGGPAVLPAPDDWRETPEGSLIIYDEAQFLWPATGKPGVPDDPRLTELATHRKGGRDIVMITQDPTLVHHWARKFISQHVHVHRPNQQESSVVYQWNTYRSDPEDHFAIKEADESRYSQDKTIWEVYDSATIHTHKFKMPPGSRWAIRFALVIALAVLVALGAMWWTSKSRAAEAATSGKDRIEMPGAHAPRSNTDTAKEPTQAQLSLMYQWRETTPTVRPINGCVASDRRCRCFDFDGLMLDLDEATCRNLAVGNIPMPMDLNRFQGHGGSSAPASAQTPASGPVDFIGAAKDQLLGQGQGSAKSPTGLAPPAQSTSSVIAADAQVASYGDLGRRRIESAPR